LLLLLSEFSETHVKINIHVVYMIRQYISVRLLCSKFLRNLVAKEARFILPPLFVVRCDRYLVSNIMIFHHFTVTVVGCMQIASYEQC